jgi:L-cysteine/cystine lyase
MREFCPALAGKTYFNYGGQGPLPTPSLEAMTASWQTIQQLGPFTTTVWPFLAEQTARVRLSLAGLCGVGPHRLALTENVSAGCVLPLWGLPWEPGDALLISDCEHPGVVAACHELARRAELQVATLPLLGLCMATAQGELAGAVLEQLDQHLTPRTRLVVLSHLLWNSGAIMPIAAVAERLQQHPRQPWLLVDAAQSLGAIPVEAVAPHADIYAFTGHKWCCGPEGLGGVALSERLLAQARPTVIGWRSLRNEASAASPFHRDARRFEVATSCVPLASGLVTSLELLADQGTPAQRLQTICRGSERLWQGLQHLDGARTLLAEPPPAGLVSFTLSDAAGLPRNTADVVETLGRAGIWIRRLDQPDCLRACIHITTTDAEIDQLLAALAAL